MSLSQSLLHLVPQVALQLVSHEISLPFDGGGWILVVSDNEAKRLEMLWDLTANDGGEPKDVPRIHGIAECLRPLRQFGFRIPHAKMQRVEATTLVKTEIHPQGAIVYIYINIWYRGSRQILTSSFESYVEAQVVKALYHRTQGPPHAVHSFQVPYVVQLQAEKSRDIAERVHGADIGRINGDVRFAPWRITHRRPYDIHVSVLHGDCRDILKEETGREIKIGTLAQGIADFIKHNLEKPWKLCQMNAVTELDRVVLRT